MAPASAPASIRDYLVVDVPTAAVGETAAAVRARLIGRAFASAELVFVLDSDQRLAGVAPLTGLLAAMDNEPMARLVQPGWPTVFEDEDREDAASRAIRNGAPGLAVCARDRRFLGAVRAADLMAILRDEHLEDLHAMAGILHHSQAARAALTAPPHRRALHRLPWLFVGLAGSSFATAVMAHFEAVLTEHVAVAFFIPAIVYLADAVGTQSEAVAVRGLSLTDGRIGRLLLGELGTGMLIGLALALAAYPLVLAAFGTAALATTVALSLFVAGSVATVIGLLLPFAFDRMGLDPAYGSGPVATVVQDVLSLLTYFAVAHATLA